MNNTHFAIFTEEGNLFAIIKKRDYPSMYSALCLAIAEEYSQDIESFTIAQKGQVENTIDFDDVGKFTVTFHDENYSESMSIAATWEY